MQNGDFLHRHGTAVWDLANIHHSGETQKMMYKNYSPRKIMMRKSEHQMTIPLCQIMPWVTVGPTIITQLCYMMDTLEDNVVNIISHDWCSVPNHALGKRRKYLHRCAMINTLEDNTVSVTPTRLHIGTLCLQIRKPN